MNIFSYILIGDTMFNLKYYVFLLIISICTFTFMKVNSYNLPLKDKVIYLDPGHGGVDNGATYKDIVEDDVNLEICYLLRSKLENKGATVYMTRYDDYDLSHSNAYFRKQSDLSNRAKVINDSKADIYLSIHLNASTSSKWHGAQIFYDDINKNNIILANKLKESMKLDRDIQRIDTKYMYKRVNIPGVLVELGFLSNAEDRDILLNDSKRQEIINDIVNGIINYLYIDK